MKVRGDKFSLMIIFIIVLNACSEPATYAPVQVVNEALPPDNGYVPERLPGNTEGFANKPESSQVTKDNPQHKQSVTPDQAVKPTFKPTTPTIGSIKDEATKGGPPSKTATKAPQTKADLAENIKNSVKTLTGPQNQKPILLTQENTKLKSALSDTINAPKVGENGKKITLKNGIKHYKSIANTHDRKKDTKKHIKTLDKLEISEKNSKTSDFSSDNKKVLKLNFQWPLRGRISRSFNQTDHKGIEIIGKNGQTVHAAEAGKAVYCGNGLAGFGNLAIIKHDDIYLSAYANNSKLIVKEGQKVGKGQVIGQLGQTGLKKAALHFEIRKYGKPINPLVVLPQN